MLNETEKYCQECGAIINKKAVICPKCGCKVRGESLDGINPQWIITVLLCGFLGMFGTHRFYNGKILSGILQLITFGGFGIWYIIDLIMIILGTFKDSNGFDIRVKN